MFLDTSGLLCYHSKDEPEHTKAQHLFKAERSHLTHSYVLAEFVALAQARKVPREPTLMFSSQLLAHPRLEIIWVDGLHQEALELLGKRGLLSMRCSELRAHEAARHPGITDY
jgi:uncharacterized protein